MIEVSFLPAGITVSCEPGDNLYDIATAAGIFIPTGCLMGCCHACEVELGDGSLVCACITPVPAQPTLCVHVLMDPTW